MLQFFSSPLFLAFAAIISAIPLWPQPAKPAIKVSERWRPELSAIQSVDAASPIVDAYIRRASGSREERLVAGVDAFVRDRFVHGFSRTPARENWALALAALTLNRDLDQPVIPDDILKHRRAICSQQAIMMMELLKRRGVEFGSVLMSWPDADPLNRGHFATAARVDGVWRYYDPNLEASASVPLSKVIDGSAIPSLYKHRPELVAKMLYAARRGQITLAHVNRFPAPRARVAQLLTDYFSRASWVVLVLAMLAGIVSRLRTRSLPWGWTSGFQRAP